MKQDYFISHASADKEAYINPLARCLAARSVSFWLDSREISWGDSVTLRINEGLRESRHVVVCLSTAFLARRWPEAELAAAFGGNVNDDGRKLLPLILNGKQEVLAHYPLLAGRLYREYDVGPDVLADELAALVANRPGPATNDLHLIIESVHTGRISNLYVSPRASAHWLAEQARVAAGLKAELDTGGFESITLRWSLVDVRAEAEWRSMPDALKRTLLAVIKTSSGIATVAFDEDKRLQDIGVMDGTVFHLSAHPVERRIVYSYAR